MNVEDWLIFKIAAPAIRIAAITGAADLGKSYLAESLVSRLRNEGRSAVSISLDSYLLPRADRAIRELSGYDPESHNFTEARADIKRLVGGEAIEYYRYRHDIGERAREPEILRPASVIIVEGLHAIHSSLAELVDFSVFIFTSDEELCRLRVAADLEKRQLSGGTARIQADSELESYYRFVYPYKARCDNCLYLEKPWRYTFT